MNDDHTKDGDDNVIAPHLAHVIERMTLLFAYHFCALEFEGDEDLGPSAPDGDRAMMLGTIRNACMNTTLIALRDLDDFFTPRQAKRGAKDDDLFASDFELDQPLQFLGVEQRTRINKLIAHTTQRGAEMPNVQWDILELVSKAHSQCDAFLEWFKEKYGLGHFDAFALAVSNQARMRKIMKWIQDEADKRRKETPQK